MQARFSLPYCVATLLTDGGLDAGSFLPAQLARAAVADLAARVTLREDPAYSAALPVERPSRVTVRLRDGRAPTAEVRNARGNPATALTRAEVESKFLRNVGDLLEPAMAQGTLTALLDPADADTHTLADLARTVLDLLARED